MDDLGAPASYLTLERGTAVYDPAGERIGAVDHVLGDANVDIFEGLIVDTRGLLGGHRFADAEQVERIHERGVVLSADADALHEPTAAPGTLRADPAEGEESALTARLRRAWDWISGNY